MKIRFDQGLALGVLIGLLISILLFWMLQVWTLNVTETFFQLVTPLVSILAALLALSGIRSQIQSNFDIAEKARKAKLDAANATLPIVLSNICRVAENRIEAIINMNSTIPEMEWRISDNDLETLKECIEYANGTEKDFMIEICSIYQVLLARWRPELINNHDSFYTENTISLKNRQRTLAITNWCTIFAFSNSLFDYARRAPSHLNKNKVKKTVIEKLKNPWKLDEITVMKNLPYNKDYIDCIETDNNRIEFVNL